MIIMLTTFANTTFLVSHVHSIIISTMNKRTKIITAISSINKNIALQSSRMPRTYQFSITVDDLFSCD